jgi:hypothetical protein
MKMPPQLLALLNAPTLAPPPNIAVWSVADVIAGKTTSWNMMTAGAIDSAIQNFSVVTLNVPGIYTIGGGVNVPGVHGGLLVLVKATVEGVIIEWDGTGDCICPRRDVCFDGVTFNLKGVQYDPDPGA